MKNILLSADGEISVYRVPDYAADELDEYCETFFRWMKESPDAQRYRFNVNGVACVQYDETDFIRYLNEYVCNERSEIIETLAGVYDEKSVPEKYRGLPYYNF